MKELNDYPVLNPGMTAKTDFADATVKNLVDADEITRFIHEDFPIRTIKEELEKVIENKAKELELTHDQIMKILRKKCGEVNVKNWLSGKAKALTKDSALKIAFALKMSYNEASWFLMQSCWLDGLYLRDYKDIIYRFCIENKMDYEQAETFIKEHSYLDNIPNPNVKPSFGYGMAVTMALDNEAKKIIKDKDDLEVFLRKNREYFGTFRRKAYEKFTELLNYVKYDYAKAKDSSKDIPTDEEICNLITMGIPSLQGKKAVINDVIKKIADEALPRTTLSEIVGKQEVYRGGNNTGKITEVKRKHLILMWLYVNAGTPDFYDSDYSDKETAFNECIMDINDHLLDPCGMPLIDPRNPFDWIVMKAIHYAYFSSDNEDDTDTVDRINEIMNLLFNRSDVNANAD